MAKDEIMDTANAYRKDNFFSLFLLMSGLKTILRKTFYLCILNI